MTRRERRDSIITTVLMAVLVVSSIVASILIRDAMTIGTTVMLAIICGHVGYGNYKLLKESERSDE